jgi:hypothetical protein
MKPLLAALVLLMSSQAHACHLHLCPAAGAPRDGVRATLADGTVLVANAAPQLPGCRARSLGVEAALVESLYPLPAGDTAAGAILLSGAPGTAPFKPSSHELPQPERPGAPPPGC